MDEARRPYAALAWLQEMSGSAAFRLNPYRTVQGQAVVMSDGLEAQLTLHLENLRTLTEKLLAAPWIYEAWLVTVAGQAVSAGAFNAGTAGAGSFTFHLEPENLRGTGIDLGSVSAVLVTAEPFDADPAPAAPILQGRLLWQGQYPAMAWGAPAAVLPASVLAELEAEPAPAAPEPPAAAAPVLTTRTVAVAGATAEPVTPAPASAATALPTVPTAAAAPSPTATATASPAPVTTTAVAAPATATAVPAPASTNAVAAPADPIPVASGPSVAPEAPVTAAATFPAVAAASAEASATAAPAAPQPPAPVAAPAAAPPPPEPATAHATTTSAVTLPPGSGPTLPWTAAAPAWPTAPLQSHEHAARPEVPLPGPVLRAQVVLSGASPLTAATQAVAQLDFSQGGILLTLRGMPQPARFGAAAATGREYGVYKAWLTSSRSHEAIPLGTLPRIWHDTYRLQARDLPLEHFDTLQVTAEDRDVTPGTNGPVVLSGRYASLVPPRR